MKLFICLDHDTYWPVGGASIAVAENEDEARSLLDKVLEAEGLKGSQEHPYTMCECSIEKPRATVLVNGDY